MQKNKLTGDRFAFFFFVASTLCLVFTYGVLVGRYHIFPFQVYASAAEGYKKLIAITVKQELPWYYIRVEGKDGKAIHRPGDAYEGLNLITKIGSDKTIVAEILDMDGQKLHEWQIDWFKIWPDAKHLPKGWVPQERPGTHIHGRVLMENGDLVFNFERLGLVRINPHGEVVWRLPYLTHHSVHRDDKGNLWVSGKKCHTKPDARFSNRKTPIYEDTFLEVTPDGRIANEWSVADLLIENDLNGLLFTGSVDNWSTLIVASYGDVLHLNDVEPFPDTMEEDFFRKGDVLVSLRNINTVFVFNRYTRKIKLLCMGWFVRQHDPDFIDGNRFSVFDNNLIASKEYGHQSRIVIVSAREKKLDVYFEGNPTVPFYTAIMGKHQWLPNGNLLITESQEGRAFEINPRGEMVWEYVNYVDNGIVGLVDEVERLPLIYNRLFTTTN